MNQIKPLFFFACLSTICFSLLLEPSLVQAQGKRPLSELANSEEKEPPAKKTRTGNNLARVFSNALIKSGRTLKKHVKTAANLATLCIDIDSLSLSSDLPSDLPSDSEISDLNIPVDATYTPPQNSISTTENIRSRIEEEFKRADFLSTHGEPTLAAEQFEQTIFFLLDLDTSLQRYQPEAGNVLNEYIMIFNFWAALPQMQRDIAGSQQKISLWLKSRPSSEWLDVASDTLVNILSAAYRQKGQNEALPSYSDVWLDDQLENITKPHERSGIKHVVLGLAANSGPSMEQHFRDAFLTGFSHPICHLPLISFLTYQCRYQEAIHVFEMYKLAGIYNSRWNNSANKRNRLRYEQIRLQNFFSYTLNHLQWQTNLPLHTTPISAKHLEASLESWPEHSRFLAEDMLFKKAFEIEGSVDTKNEAIQFAVNIIARSRQRWKNANTLQEMVSMVQDYITGFSAQRAPHRLYEHLALMLVDLDMEQKASDLFYEIPPSNNKEREVEDLAFDIIAISHQFYALNRHYVIPRYDKILEIVRQIQRAGHKDTLDNRLQTILSQVRQDEADISKLLQLYLSTYSDLTKLNPDVEMIDSLPTPLTDSEVYLYIINQIKQSKQSPSPIRVFAGYTFYNVPADGLCMYHALSQVLNISVPRLIVLIRDRLLSIQERIFRSIYNKKSWDSELTPNEAAAVHPIVYVLTDEGEDFIPEDIATVIQNLESAHLQLTSHISQGTNAWAPPSIFNLAALIANEENPQQQQSFITQTTPLNDDILTPEWTLYSPSGSQDSIEMPSGSLPLIILTNSNLHGRDTSHYMYALPTSPSTPAIEDPQLEHEELNSMEDFIQDFHRYFNINDTESASSIHSASQQEGAFIFTEQSEMPNQ